MMGHKIRRNRLHAAPSRASAVTQLKKNIHTYLFTTLKRILLQPISLSRRDIDYLVFDILNRRLVERKNFRLATRSTLWRRESLCQNRWPLLTRLSPAEFELACSEAIINSIYLKAVS